VAQQFVELLKWHSPNPAKTRSGTPCQCPAMKNGRCRLHGGLSTGPKTPEGIERIRRANLKHGKYTKAAKHERRLFRAMVRDSRALLKEIRAMNREGTRVEILRRNRATRTTSPPNRPQ
jgi:hypothetical protein